MLLVTPIRGEGVAPTKRTNAIGNTHSRRGRRSYKANQRMLVTPIRGEGTAPTKFHLWGGFAPMTVNDGSSPDVL